MRQRILADEGFEKFRKPTREEQFLDEMDQIIHWRDLCKVLKPFYPKPKGARNHGWLLNGVPGGKGSVQVKNIVRLPMVAAC